jgi:phage shock protein C
MALSDELAKLQELHQRGALTDDEFILAKARVLDAAHGPGNPAPAAPAFVAAANALRRSRSDRWLAGVCGGIALATGVHSWIWRLAFATMAFFAGTGIVLYLLLWIFVPEE